MSGRIVVIAIVGQKFACNSLDILGHGMQATQQEPRAHIFTKYGICSSEDCATLENYGSYGGIPHYVVRRQSMIDQRDQWLPDLSFIDKVSLIQLLGADSFKFDYSEEKIDFLQRAMSPS